MVIIEGCDAVGKSTLAKWLAKELGYDYFKDSFHKLGTKYYIGNALKKPFNIVSDRFHLGEYVYPTVKQDGRVPMPVWHQLMVERILLTKTTVLILCETDIETIWHNFDTRGEDFITKEQAVDVVRLFNERFDVSILPKIKFNYKLNDQNDLLKFIKSNFQRYINGSLIADQMESTGETNSPDVMLVGEGYNARKIGKAPRAFSHLSASSAYLHEALANNQDVSYYITNAGKTGDPIENKILLLDEIDRVGPKKIIALGNVASKLLKQLNIDHETTVHPSYQRRFKHSQINEYSKTLR